MRVAFINTPLIQYSKRNKKDNQSMAPMGLAMLATIAQNSGHEVLFIDAESESLPITEILSRIKLFKPHYACINVLSPTNSISSKIIDNLDCKVIVGGYHASICSAELLKMHKNIYAVVRGEAEPIFEGLLEGKPLQEIKGITFRKGRKISSNPEPETLSAIDSLPIINRQFIKHELMQHGEASIIASRGCSYNCSFCAVPVMSKKIIRWRSPASVVEEMIAIANEYGIRRFHFLDNVFLLNVDWLKDFISLLKTKNAKMEWRCITRADVVARLSNDILSKIKRVGCTKICIGLESGSQKILDKMNKGLSIEESKRAIAKCRKAGIGIKAYFLIGHPAETKEDRDKTLKFVLNNKLQDIRFIPLKAYPGTPLFESVKREKKLFKYTQIQNLFKPSEIRNIAIDSKSLMKYLQVQPEFSPARSILSWIRLAYKKVYSV